MNPLHQKREIEGIEILNAIFMAFEVSKHHPDMSLLDVLVHGLLYILYDPDIYEKNRAIAKDREARAVKNIDLKLEKTLDEVLREIRGEA